MGNYTKLLLFRELIAIRERLVDKFPHFKVFFVADVTQYFLSAFAFWGRNTEGYSCHRNIGGDKFDCCGKCHIYYQASPGIVNYEGVRAGLSESEWDKSQSQSLDKPGKDICHVCAVSY